MLSLQCRRVTQGTPKRNHGVRGRNHCTEVCASAYLGMGSAGWALARDGNVAPRSAAAFIFLDRFLGHRRQLKHLVFDDGMLKLAVAFNY
jgi:hypothetical protein